MRITSIISGTQTSRRAFEIPCIPVLLRAQPLQAASHLQGLSPFLLELLAVLLCLLALQPINGAQELQGLAEVLLLHQQLLLQQEVSGFRHWGLLRVPSSGLILWAGCGLALQRHVHAAWQRWSIERDCMGAAARSGSLHGPQHSLHSTQAPRCRWLAPVNKPGAYHLAQLL